jgi:outer membrane protein assembly factor BamB
VAKVKIKAVQVIRDINVGVDDSDLMTKYNLSAQGLQSLFTKLVEAGLLSQSELDKRAALRENTVVVDFVAFPVTTLKWKFAAQDIAGSPLIAGGVVYFGSWDGHVHALDLSTGGSKWIFKTEGSVSAAPALSGRFVCFGSGDGHMYCLEAETGREKWRFKTQGPIFSAPTIAGGLVYFGSADHHVYAVDLTTGAEEWKFEVRGPVHSTIAVSDDIVCFGSDDKCVYALQASSHGGFSVQARTL